MVQLLKIQNYLQIRLQFPKLTWKTNNCSMLQLILFQSFRINAIFVVNTSIILCNTNARGSGTCKVPTRVKSHVTKPLHNIGLASPSWSVPDHGHVLGFIDEVLKTMKHSSTSCTRAAVNTSLVNGFT